MAGSESFYYITEPYVRVSRIAKLADDPEPLIRWAMRQGAKAAEVRDASAQRGTDLHAAIVKGLRGEGWPSDEPYAVTAFRAWATEVSFKPILTEHLVYHRDLRVAGTLDLYGEVRGEPTVLDIKTGKSVYPSHHLQVAAYRVLGWHCEAIPISSGACLVLQLPAESGDAREHIADDYDRAWITFTQLLAAWRWRRRVEGLPDAWGPVYGQS